MNQPKENNVTQALEIAYDKAHGAYAIAYRRSETAEARSEYYAEVGTSEQLTAAYAEQDAAYALTVTADAALTAARLAYEAAVTA